MIDPDEQAARKLAGLIGRLPANISPPVDLWPAIHERLATSVLDEMTNELRREVEPPPELWLRIESQLVRPQSARRLVAAAAAFAAIAATLFGAGMLSKDELASRDADVAASVSADAVLWRLGRAAPDRHDVARTFQANLDLVRSARLAIEQELALRPFDLNLHGLWAHAYEAELRLESDIDSVALIYQRGYGI